MDNSRPYLAYFPKRGVPKLVKDAKDFESDLEPTISNWAQFFTNVKRVKFSDKLQPKDKCIQKLNQFEETLTVRVEEKPSVVSSIVQGIIAGERSDTIVLVEDRQFACSGLVLSTYSNYFMNRRGQTEIDLRNSPLTVQIFDYIYKWLLNSVKHILAKDLAQVIRAAYFLEIPNMLQICLTLLDGTRFKEIEAFSLIHQMRSYADLYHINEAMSSRISSCTLMVLCSVQFLNLTDVQICQLLKSSFLAVNSETEILFCTLHWLARSWPDRRSHVLKVLKCIRYAYLSPKILRQLNGQDFGKIGPFVRVLKEFKKFPEAKQKIEDGIFYSTLVITMNSDPGQMIEVPNANNDLIMPRRWMQDIRCKYHRPVSKLCPNMRYVSYENFVEYAEILLSSNSRYEDYIQYPEDNEKSAIESQMDFNFSSKQAKMKEVTPASSFSSIKECICLKSSLGSSTSDCIFIKDFKPPKNWKTLKKMAFRNEDESD